MSTRNVKRRPARTIVAPGRELSAASYERVSKLVISKGERAGYAVTRGVKRQAKAAERQSAERGTGPVRHFTDEGQSASEFATKARTEWPEFLSYVREGNATHVYLMLLDRSLRKADDVSVLLEACREGGAVIVQTATEDVIDPWKPEDVKRARDAGSAAEYEISKMSMRQLTAKADAAEAGQPHGGRKRFGYKAKLKKGRLVIDKKEAAIIRELVDRFLMGESLYSLAKWLRENEVPSPQGGKWASPNLGPMLAGPHLAGLRQHQGKVIGKGAWEPIITEAEHDAIVAKLSTPSRQTNKTPGARRYLLTGLGMCAACGRELKGRVASGKRKGTAGPSYACATGRHVHRDVTAVENAVNRLMVHRLSQIDASGAFRDTAALDRMKATEAALGAIPAKRKALSDQWAAGEISDATKREDAAALDRREAALRAELAEATEDARRPERVLEGLAGGTLAEAEAAWKAASLHRRRAALDHLAWVFLRGANGQRRPFDPERDLIIVSRTTGELWG